MIDLKCKKCRRLGQKLFLKGDRCFSQKCAMVRRPYAPGMHGKSRHRRLSEYGQQLAEKQKIRFTYGISETQLKNYFKSIANQKGNKEALFIQKLENRLDNVVFRLGWASSRRLARQLVGHGHIMVNGRKVTIPSYSMKNGDQLQIREESKTLNTFQNLKEILKKHKLPTWLNLIEDKLSAEVKGDPSLEDVTGVGQISMIIEYYSR